MTKRVDKNIETKHSIALNATLNTIKTVAGMMLSLLTFPYATRVLGVNAIGSYNFSYSFISYALLISALGTMSYAIREGAKYRNDSEKMTEFTSEIFSISVISTALSYLLLFGVIFLTPALCEYRLMIVILSAEIICNTIGVNWIGNIYEDFLYITLRTLGFQILYIILLFTFVRGPEDIYTYALITTFTASGANILNFLYLRKKYVKFRFTFNIDWKKHLKPILVIFSTKIAISIYVNSDKTILGFLTNDIEVGLYSTSVKIYSIIKEILVAMITVLIPRFSIILDNKTKDEASEFFSNVFKVFSILLIPATVGLFMMSPEIIFTIAGEEYLRAIPSLRILSIAVLFSLYANIYTTCVLVPSRKESKVFYATFISAGINVGLNFIFIPLWGLNGAALTTVIAELIIFILSVVSSKEVVYLINVKRDIITIGVSCAMIVLVCAGTKFIISNIYIRLMVAMIASAIMYTCTLLITKNPVASKMKYRVLSKIGRSK